MPKPELSSKEKCLIFFTTIMVLAAIAMAALIGFVLPYHWTRDEYVCCSKSSDHELVEQCRCYRSEIRNITSDKSTNCFITASEGCARAILISKNRPTFIHKYVVWLSIPAYSDDMEQRFACNGVIVRVDAIVIRKYNLDRSFGNFYMMHKLVIIFL